MSSDILRFNYEKSVFAQVIKVHYRLHSFVTPTLQIIESTSTTLPETTTNAALNNSISDAPVTGSDQTTPSGGLYPPELFNMKQKRSGAVLLYCLCLLYMFCALAIVCDEFFVPALEVIYKTFWFGFDDGFDKQTVGKLKLR